MVYISSDGRIEAHGDGLSFQNLKRTFWRFVDGVLLFFQTLLYPAGSGNNRYISNRGPSSSQSLKGGGKRIGRPANVSGLSPPPCAPGGG